MGRAGRRGEKATTKTRGGKMNKYAGYLDMVIEKISEWEVEIRAVVFALVVAAIIITVCYLAVGRKIVLN
jgi:hypothetical protein